MFASEIRDHGLELLTKFDERRRADSDYVPPIVLNVSDGKGTRTYILDRDDKTSQRASSFKDITDAVVNVAKVVVKVISVFT